jgi:hypothetical protein
MNCGNRSNHYRLRAGPFAQGRTATVNQSPDANGPRVCAAYGHPVAGAAGRKELRQWQHLLASLFGMDPIVSLLKTARGLALRAWQGWRDQSRMGRGSVVHRARQPVAKRPCRELPQSGATSCSTLRCSRTWQRPRLCPRPGETSTTTSGRHTAAWATRPCIRKRGHSTCTEPGGG